MSCSCKNNKPFNNTRNADYIIQAKATWNEIIKDKDISQLSELDSAVIIQTYKSLYPSSTGTPSIEEAINQINIAIQTYEARRTTKQRR